MLRRRELGEHDLMVTLLSNERGRIQAAARSSRKVTSRTMGKLELGSEVDATLASGKSLDVLTEVRSVALHQPLRDDLELLACTNVLLELFDVVVEPGPEAQGLLPLLSASLHLLEAGVRSAVLLRWTEIGLLHHLGLQPDLSTCGTCQGVLEAAGVAFSVQSGYALCRRCQAQDASAWPLYPGTVALYGQLLRTDATLLPRLNADHAVLRQLEDVMRSHLSYRWPHRLKSLAFLDQVRRLR